MSFELVECTQAFLWALPAREGERAAGACAPSVAAAD